METSIWQGHSSFSFISICGWPVTHAFISCLPVYLPHLSAGHFICYTNFIHFCGLPSPWNNKKFFSVISSPTQTRLCLSVLLPVCLSCCLTLHPFCNTNRPLRAKEKHYTAAPCHAGRHHPHSGFNFCATYCRHQSPHLFVSVCARRRETMCSFFMPAKNLPATHQVITVFNHK